MKTNTCKSCRFWFSDEPSLVQFWLGERPTGAPEYRECHYNAPVKSRAGNPWPWTVETSFCGQFAQRENEAANGN